MMRWLWLWLLAGGLLSAAEEMEVAGKGRVNVRQSPSARANTIAKLKGGERVQVKAIKGEWAELEGRPGFVAARLLRKPAAGKPAAENKTAKGKPAAAVKSEAPEKSADTVKLAGSKSDHPFADLPVVPKSGKDVTVKGMLYPMKNKGPVAYVLLKAVNGQYQIDCYVYVYKKETSKFTAFANKDVQLVGTWYKVKDWKKPVLQVRSIKEL